MQKGDFVVGVARGLSFHSSLQDEFKSLFHSSNEVELSSIKKPANSSSNSDIPLFKKPSPQCRFCTQGELFERRLIKVCNCTDECWGHESCVIKTKKVKRRCLSCKADWITVYERESQLSLAPHVSFLQSIEESGEVGESSVKQSSISESSGEERMRNIVQAASLKAFCRLCHKDEDSADNRLIYPCQCHTLKPQDSWAHRKCMREYMLARQSDTCDRCKVRFAINYRREKYWCCKEFSSNQAFVTQIAALLLGVGVLSCLIALLTAGVMDYSVGEEVWAYVLVACCVLLLLALCFALGLVVCQNSRRLHIQDIFVLCQKQEIAQMTSKSHQIFLAFLAQNHLKLAKLPSNQTPLTSHKTKLKAAPCRYVSNPIFEEPENTQRSDDMLNPQDRDFSPILAASQTHEENANSQDLREHSLVRESLVLFDIDEAHSHSFSVAPRSEAEDDNKTHSFYR